MTIIRHTLCRLAAAVIMLTVALLSYADGISDYYIQGIVKDSVTDLPLPYASVVDPVTARGTVTDARGLFEISVPDNARILNISCVGYNKKVLPINKNRVNVYAVYLSPSTTELQEVVVRKKKYSKKNNPAVEFARKLRNGGGMTDPRRNDFYNYDKYEKISVAINNFDGDKDNALMRNFAFLKEHVDTSDISGKPILNILVKEKFSHIDYRRDPHSEKERVEGVRSQGFNSVNSEQGIRTFLEDVMREVDLYDDDINLLQNRFVSPLSKIATDFYKFYLTDTVEVDNERCIVLSFYPFNNAAFGFIGHIYIPENDSTMFIKKVDMRLPRDINLNFIDKLYLSQTYARAADGSRLKTRDDLTVEIIAVPGTPGIYARRNTVYAGHGFDRPADESVFGHSEKLVQESDAENRDEAYWQNVRLASISANENRVDQMFSRLRKMPVYYWTEKVLKAFFNGYVTLTDGIDYGPVNTTLSFNSVEGTRLRVGGMTTSGLSKRWFARGYVAYGTRDHRWKYKGELEYSFIDKKYHSREFPMKSLRLTHMYDIDKIGQHYMFTNQDNIFLSLRRMKDDRVIYHRLTSLEYNLELANNFSVSAEAKTEWREATPWVRFIDGYGCSYSHYAENSLSVTLRYAPGEKYFQTRSHRIPVNLDAPVIALTHTFAPAGFLGTRFPINKTELMFQKRFWLSAFGYVDAIVGGGHVWSKSSYIDLLIPNANLSYTIQPESFALMNPLEFINDSSVSWFLTYWANGAILNYIPYLKKLKLREVFSFSGLYGHLSRRNDPSFNKSLFVFPDDVTVREMTDGPYMEASVGLDNIFRCLRVDYVWRLSYRRAAYEIDRSGLRIAVHVTF